MGRRGRRRAETFAQFATADRPARVRVDDEVWRDFRHAIGDTPIASYLGQMVEAEVGRGRTRRLHEDRVTNSELLTAITRARALRDELVALVDRLEHRIERGW